MIAAPAYLDLARNALADGDAGRIPEVEALSAAEIFTRFASGDPESARYLGLLLLHRCDDAAKAGDTQRECMFGSMALARLDVAADAGDDLAAGALLNAKTSPEALMLARSMLAGSFRETTATEDAICLAAGAGDESALNAVLDEVVTCLHEGIRPARDALHLGVTVARVGEHFGHGSLMLRLCGLLLLMGELDEQEGYDDSKLACDVCAIIKLTDLTADGFSGAEANLAAVIAATPRAAFAAAAQRPALLDRLPQSGECQ